MFDGSVGIGSGLFHPSLGMPQFAEFELSIEPVSIFGGEHPSAQALKFGMLDHHLHEPLAQSLTPVFVEDEYIADVSKRCFVTDHSGKPDLLVSKVNAKADRILDRGCGLFERAVARPVRLFREEFMNDSQIEPTFIRADRELAMVNIGHSCSLADYLADPDLSDRKLATCP